MDITGTLEDWIATGEIANGECVMWGNIYNDIFGRWPNGTWIHTSGVVLIDFQEGDIIETQNSRYLLGKQGLLDG